MKLIKASLLIFLLIFSSNVFSQTNVIDRIIAVVGKNMIKESELETSFLQSKSKYGIIDNSGKIIFPVKYSQILTCDIDNSQKTYFKVNSEDKWGFIELANAKTISSEKYDGIECFKDGLAKVKLNNKYGYIDENGREMIPIKYDWVAMYLADGLAGVKLNNKYGYVDKNNHAIIPIKYDWINFYFSDDLVGVELNGKYGFVNRDGQEVIQLKYDKIEKSFSNGIASVILNDKLIYINKTGNEYKSYDDVELEKK